MKKNLIYTLCILLSGAFFFNSCEDMLDVDSGRVQHDFGKLTLNDSVYSVLGILKSVQNVADRTVLLGELRSDLVVPNDGKAVYDIQDLCNFSADPSSPYLSVKDYYTIINNCNIFLERVDTTLERLNKKLMLREYVAVKSVRAWTYMQLAINYGSVPYFTEPVYTHSQAKEIMSRPMKSSSEIFSLLIDDLVRYEDPRVYPMPEWTGIKTGVPRVEIPTNMLFVPIRALLGELHLWRGEAGDYRMAADYFYKSITETPQTGTSASSRTFFDASSKVAFTFSETNKYDFYVDLYSNIFKAAGAITSKNALTVIPMETSTSTGTISYLSEIFYPDVMGGAQVAASPGYIALSNRQSYYLFDEEKEDEQDPVLNPSKDEFVGDLRRYTFVGNQYNAESEEVFGNIIAKHNFANGPMTSNGLNQILPLNSNRTNFVQIYRDVHLYARFAEALIGLSKEKNCPDALSMAMDILKKGLEDTYNLRTNLSYKDSIVAVLDTLGNPILNAAGEDSTLTYTVPVYDELIAYDFGASMYEVNSGLHSRGSGNSEYNVYYAMNDKCIARYYNLVTEETDSTFVTTRDIADEDRYRYVNDLLLDELALEFCFEGYRFGDLIRFAKRAERDGFADWKDILAKRVAGRKFANKLNYHNNDSYQMDNSLYSFLLNEANWFLPLPGTIEVTVPEDPTDEPTEDDTTIEDTPVE